MQKLLINIATTINRGKHCFSWDTYDKADYACDLVSKRKDIPISYVFDYLDTNFIDMSSLKGKINHYVRIVDNQNLSLNYRNNKDKIWEIDFRDDFLLNIFEDPNLISEDLTDCFVYRKIVDCYCSLNNIPVAIALRPCNGGGANINKSIKIAVSRNEPFLVITDSDKSNDDSLDSIKYKKTWEKAQEAVDQIQVFSIYSIKKLEVHELENLLASKYVFEKLYSKKEFQMINLLFSTINNFCEFYDFKKGLSQNLTKLLKSNNMTEINKIEKNTFPKTTKITKNVIKNNLDFNEIYHMLYTKGLKDEWNNIGKMLLSFCCCDLYDTLTKKRF